MTYLIGKIYPKKGVLLSSLVLLAGCLTGQAQIDWSGGAGDGIWSTPGNWVGGNVPDSNSEDPEFETASFSVPGDQTVAINSPTTARLFRFRTDNNVTINGSSTLTIDNGGSGTIGFWKLSGGTGGNLTVNPNIDVITSTGMLLAGFSGSQITFNGNISRTSGAISDSTTSSQVTFNGSISGSGRIYASELRDDSVITMTAANTYTGDTTIQGGTLVMTNNATFGDGTGRISIIGRSTLDTADAVLELNNLNNTNISNDYTFGGDGFSGAGVLRITGGDATFSGAGSATGNGGRTTALNTASGSTLTFANTFRVVNISTYTLRFDGDGDVQTTGSGAITENVGSGSSTIIKNGSGTLTFGGAANTYEGPTIINGGALVLNAAGNSINGGGLTLNSGTSASLSKSDQIGSSVLTLNSATFNTNGFDEALGALVLQGTSDFDLGSGDSVIAFADSSGQSWTAGQTFVLLNWTGSISGGGTDQVLFGSDASGLTSGQLSQVIFRNPDGFGAGDYAAQILGTGEVVPVPEASTYALVLGLVAGVYLIYRRRKQAVKVAD